MLNQDSLESGGPTADYKVLCDEADEIRVDSFTAAGSSFEEVVEGARAAGFDDPDIDYTIFFEARIRGVCGVASYYEDERLTAANASNGGGGYAIAYDGCWFNSAPMHENGHNQGAVQAGAPHSTGTGGHCNDGRDVMCYSPDGGDINQGGTIELCADRVHFDCGYDTYFDSAPETAEYLASHWNIGSSLNRFISFGEGGGAPSPDEGTPPDDGGPPPDGPPTADFAYRCTYTDCSFSDLSSDAEGEIVSREWSFGDGGSAVSAEPSHRYSAAGTYVVSLAVVDEGGRRRRPSGR